MEEKIFKVPPKFKSLNSYYWKLRQEACEELKQNGISEEPRKVDYETLQKICKQHPKGALATYVQEMQKGFRMNKDELQAYDIAKESEQKAKIVAPIKRKKEETNWESLDNNNEFNDSTEIDFDGIDDFFDEK
ncbi:MAG: hypothetical protein HQM14_04815 [SAR324 cluster bacterium]|nr:hypothetical protein [SAR324 cluster bacterium]